MTTLLNEGCDDVQSIRRTDGMNGFEGVAAAFHLVGPS